jgi:hypothetical protein
MSRFEVFVSEKENPKQSKKLCKWRWLDDCQQTVCNLICLIIIVSASIRCHFASMYLGYLVESWNIKYLGRLNDHPVLWQFIQNITFLVLVAIRTWSRSIQVFIRSKEIVGKVNNILAIEWSLMHAVFETTVSS